MTFTTMNMGEKKSSKCNSKDDFNETKEVQSDLTGTVGAYGFGGSMVTNV